MEQTENKNGDTRGILRPAGIDRKFTLSRHAPPEEHAYFMEHYWIVRWDLRGQAPYESATLPFPSVHAVIETDRADVWGVVTGRFTRKLEGEGRAFGMKFRPAAFRAFVDRPVSELTDRTFPLEELFGSAGTNLVGDLNSIDDDSQMVEMAGRFVDSLRPRRDDNIDIVNRVIGRIVSDRSLTGVDQIVDSEKIAKRSLQRLFREYVGVGPKWVIRRYRLQEAADMLAQNEKIDLPQLALELGYFDQAHFTKDFKSIIGISPGGYANDPVPE